MLLWLRQTSDMGSPLTPETLSTRARRDGVGVCCWRLRYLCGVCGANRDTTGIRYSSRRHRPPRRSGRRWAAPSPRRSGDGAEARPPGAAPGGLPVCARPLGSVRRQRVLPREAPSTRSALGAVPLEGQIDERRHRLDAAHAIALQGIVDVAAYPTDVPLQTVPPFARPGVSAGGRVLNPLGHRSWASISS